MKVTSQMRSPHLRDTDILSGEEHGIAHTGD
jgi:hypothetical protein